MIYIEGKVIEQTEEESDDLGILMLIVEQDDGKKWCVGVPGEDEIEEINEQNVRIYGEYQGYSGEYNLPAMMVDTEDSEKIEQARIDIYNESGYTTVWRFSEYVDEYYDKIANRENNIETEAVEKAENVEETEKKDVESTITLGQSNALEQAKRYVELKRQKVIWN